MKFECPNCGRIGGYLIAAWCAAVGLLQAFTTAQAGLLIMHSENWFQLFVGVMVGAVSLVICYYLLFCVHNIMDRTATPPMILLAVLAHGVSVLLRAPNRLETIVFVIFSVIALARFRGSKEEIS